LATIKRDKPTHQKKKKKKQQREILYRREKVKDKEFRNRRYRHKGRGQQIIGKQFQYSHQRKYIGIPVRTD